MGGATDGSSGLTSLDRRRVPRARSDEHALAACAYIDDYMRRLSFFIAPDVEAGLKALKAEHGPPKAETIRRALAEYLNEKGVLKAHPKGGRTSTKRT